MQVTTSRKPSPKARRFAKVLASFLSVPYSTRGKSGLDPDEVWMVVVEKGGSPRGVVKRAQGEEETLSFVVSAEKKVQRLKRRKPLVVGPSKEARSLAAFFGLEWAPESDASRTIRVDGERLTFVDEDETILSLGRYEGPC